jgi:DNA-binding transcriptional LysR family regulator
MASRRLARLEARLGVALAHRTTRRLGLTARGESFYGDVLRLLAVAQAAQAPLTGGPGGPAGPLQVTAAPAFGRLHIAPDPKTFLDGARVSRSRSTSATTMSISSPVDTIWRSGSRRSARSAPGAGLPAGRHLCGAAARSLRFPWRRSLHRPSQAPAAIPPTMRGRARRRRPSRLTMSSRIGGPWVSAHPKRSADRPFGLSVEPPGASRRASGPVCLCRLASDETASQTC